ncbi:MAG: hypothetical protein HZA24_12105 [Nitrospirae bacterium]|nr:hypothetical protein [Nitrospirota bacterium]
MNTPFRPTPLEDIFPDPLAPPAPATPRPIQWRGRPGEETPLWAILGEQPPYGWHPPVPAPPHGFRGDALDGAGSWFRGIGRAGDHLFATMGATNAQDHAAAQRANDIFFNALKQAATHPRQTYAILKQAAPVASDYVQAHPWEVAGRMGTGLGATAIGTRLRTPYAAGALTALAAYGDTMHAIRNGANTIDSIVQAVVGGKSPSNNQTTTP